MSTDSRTQLALRCPECGRARPAGVEDGPGYHARNCLRRRQLGRQQRKAVNLKTYRPAQKTIGGDITAKLDSDGFVIAAVSFDGLRWKAY